MKYSDRVSEKLYGRSQGLCELCASGQTKVSYVVSPRETDEPENCVALCETCLQMIVTNNNISHWQCLAGSIWNTEPSVQALSYRILYGIRENSWAAEIIDSVQLDEQVVHWALSPFEEKLIHKDSNGIELVNGDTVVLTQLLNVKGANFMAPKGTIVKKIRLVPDNHEQIEGKVNDQTIVILTKFVRKSG